MRTMRDYNHNDTTAGHTFTGFRQQLTDRGNRLHKAIVLRGTLLIITYAIVAGHPLPLHASETVHHDLFVTLSPVDSRIHAKDTITLPKGSGNEISFILHAALKPLTLTPGARIVHRGSSSTSVPFEMFRISLPVDTNIVTIEYSGVIRHPLEAVGREQSRGFSDTPGLISDEGVFLSGNTLWYPRVGDGFETFSLSARMPAGWVAVSQGVRTSYDRKEAFARWESGDPQQEIYLVASKFTEYEKTSGDLLAMVFLRRPDQDLANKYLDAALKYLALYDKLIGPYPYRKFALVENFWETGFGMPSFTLLGPTVIRLPFIINTSYPHEILHNWWGNSVYPRYERGNWSEGLTAYLADHLLKEQQGVGAEYRLTTLQKYVDYAQGNKDFPLTQFRYRHSPATEAVGYGKALMFFHMLRLELEDRTFVDAVRDFYRKNKFRLADFDDLRKSFEAASGKDLKAEFDQWIKIKGAPAIRLVNVKTTRHGKDYVLIASLEQVQDGEAYRLHIPVALTLEGQDRAYQAVVDMNEKKQNFLITVPFRPLRLDIDPEFDVFRRLDRDEIPPAVTQALGARKMLVLLPSSAEKELLKAYTAFAKSIANAGPDDTEVKLDSEVKHLPTDRAVTVLGWDNRFLEKLLPFLNCHEVTLSHNNVTMGKTGIAKANHDFVLTARNPGNKNMALLFVAADQPQSLPGLARKLPHYHQFSYLAFEGDEPVNVAKGRCPVVDSPLTTFPPDRDGTAVRVEMGTLALREPLASPPISSLRDN